ncbi:D-alanyl-D-alanine carboxypeptidase family protein [Bacillus daqingensis]|uniref:serine-type D-Ala-D-Ala carboxypeptidase n=1 Tax=Bacillus daqingensis TaxID=872396 RepID=A0ABV9P0C9_9BACI
MVRKLQAAAAGTLLTAGIFAGAVPAMASYEPSVDTVILVDGETGQILFEQNADNPLPPASMTKMMSEYLILEAVNNGDIAWDDEVEVSEFLNQLSHNRGLSNVPMRVDETYTVQELYESVAIYSANAATMALTEHISGSEGNFVELMNERGADLGMGETLREAGSEYGMDNLEEIAAEEVGDFQFVNSTGLPNTLLEGNHPEGTGSEEDNFMSAQATATLAYHLVNDYPEVLDTASIPTMTFREGTEDEVFMENWNWMLDGTRNPDTGEDVKYDPIDGLKTGHTNAAGFTFTGTAEQDGQRFISVVMGAGSEAERFTETKAVMEWAFDAFSEEEIYPENMTMDGYETLPVVKGEEESVALATNAAFSEMVEEGDEENYSYTVELDESLLNEDGEMEAPVEAGTTVGRMVVEYEGDREIAYLPGEGENGGEIEIVTTDSVERAGWMALTMHNVGSFFSGVWSNVSNSVRGWF